MMGRAVPASLVACASLLSISCAAETFPVTPRVPGARTPLSAACSPFDDERCLVPWPSNTFTVADATTATGLRVHADVSSINPMDQGASRLSWADGFSRVTSVVVSFEGDLDAASFGGPRGGAMRLFVASPGEHFGEEVPLALEEYRDAENVMLPRTALVGDTLAVLLPATDYVAVVTDSLRTSDETMLSANRATEVALGLAAPASHDEAALAGYHAPTVALLEHVGVDLHHVLRAWDFTTRSEANGTHPLTSMVSAATDAIDHGAVTVEWDSVVQQPSGGAIATILEGRLVGLPNWLDATGALVADENGVPMQQGTGSAPFRVVVPAGTGDYRAVLYGHGAAGNYHDDAFDATLAAENVAKVGVQFYGWTDTELVATMARLVNILDGGHRAFAPLMQAAAHASAIGHALGRGAVLEAALSAPMLNGMPNPNAGRHVDWSSPTWVGGSLGGTMGLVISSISDEIRFAVLNVPGAAWSHWAYDSVILHTFLSAITTRNRGLSNTATMIAIGQTVFDPADGATFGELSRAGHDVYLEQESIGDMVLPNAGNEFVAIATGATQVGAVLSPIEGAPHADHVAGASGMTQYQVSDTGLYDVHGFAARDTPAGHAAFDQIQRFLNSAWAGAPDITIPPGCAMQTCVF
jgi:hypothetical protein